MFDASGSWLGATAKDIARAVRRGDTSATQVLADHLDAALGAVDDASEYDGGWLVHDPAGNAIVLTAAT